MTSNIDLTFSEQYEASSAVPSSRLGINVMPISLQVEDLTSALEFKKRCVIDVGLDIQKIIDRLSLEPPALAVFMLEEVFATPESCGLSSSFFSCLETKLSQHSEEKKQNY